MIDFNEYLIERNEIILSWRIFFGNSCHEERSRIEMWILTFDVFLTRSSKIKLDDLQFLTRNDKRSIITIIIFYFG